MSSNKAMTFLGLILYVAIPCAAGKVAAIQIQKFRSDEPADEGPLDGQWLTTVENASRASQDLVQEWIPGSTRIETKNIKWISVLPQNEAIKALAFQKNTWFYLTLNRGIIGASLKLIFHELGSLPGVPPAVTIRPFQDETHFEITHYTKKQLRLHLQPANVMSKDNVCAESDLRVFNAWMAYLKCPEAQKETLLKRWYKLYRANQVTTTSQQLQRLAKQAQKTANIQNTRYKSYNLDESHIKRIESVLSARRKEAFGDLERENDPSTKKKLTQTHSALVVVMRLFEQRYTQVSQPTQNEMKRRLKTNRIQQRLAKHRAVADFMAQVRTAISETEAAQMRADSDEIKAKTETLADLASTLRVLQCL